MLLLLFLVFLPFLFTIAFTLLNIVAAQCVFTMKTVFRKLFIFCKRKGGNQAAMAFLSLTQEVREVGGFFGSHTEPLTEGHLEQAFNHALQRKKIDAKPIFDGLKAGTLADYDAYVEAVHAQYARDDWFGWDHWLDQHVGFMASWQRRGVGTSRRGSRRSGRRRRTHKKWSLVTIFLEDSLDLSVYFLNEIFFR